jgi:hypothetical protein
MNDVGYELLKFSMGGVIGLERDEEGKWQIAFEVTPELLRRKV